MNMHRSTGVSLALLAAMCTVAPVTAQDIPSHPSELEFAPLEFSAPKASDYRHELSNGVIVYLAPSREFPLIDLTMTFRGGVYLEPDGTTGLASMTGRMMRRGGTEAMSAEDVDERLDFLASQVGIGVGDVSSSVSMNCLTSNFEETFGIVLDMVRRPAFQQDRVDLERAEIIERLRQRNDNASSIVSREWSWLLYGEDHFSSRQASVDEIESITVDDMHRMHGRIFHPGNLYIAVSGDFDVDNMLSRLEQAMTGWDRGPTAPPIPEPDQTPEPGVYHVEKDIPQGKVRIGLRAIERDHPDYFPMMLMNDILGGGGFTSRITNRVRSDEGLAYSARSGMSMTPYYPGAWTASFDSKNRTVALAIKLIMEEVDRIRNEPVTEEELETSKAAFIETFPRTFESRPTMLSVFVSDDITDRSPEYWQTYRDRVRGVTRDDVQRVARDYLTPEQMAILVVGKWDEIYGGDLEGRAAMGDFFNGNVTHRPQRDPMTMEPVRE